VNGVPPDGFKTAPDGQKVFYPWGNLSRRGYIFSSQKAAIRFRILINAFVATTVILMIVANSWRYLGVVIVLAASISFYVIWMCFVVRGLTPYIEPEAPSGN
jgi:fatty acid desaturase